ILWARSSKDGAWPFPTPSFYNSGAVPPSARPVKNHASGATQLVRKRQRANQGARRPARQPREGHHTTRRSEAAGLREAHTRAQHARPATPAHSLSLSLSYTHPPTHTHTPPAERALARFPSLPPSLPSIHTRERARTFLPSPPSLPPSLPGAGLGEAERGGASSGWLLCRSRGREEERRRVRGEGGRKGSARLSNKLVPASFDCAAQPSRQFHSQGFAPTITSRVLSSREWRGERGGGGRLSHIPGGKGGGGGGGERPEGEANQPAGRRRERPETEKERAAGLRERHSCAGAGGGASFWRIPQFSSPPALRLSSPRSDASVRSRAGKLEQNGLELKKD
ncbi:serine/arginine repetitive matrix protein 3-like, partial [Pseudonaja textilis]|uniref:serine/arginine repetitive matrix protein 3-like n=1 Tax=Pseudonaja textilis TaxID=8673 RepID=UPI000EA89603